MLPVQITIAGLKALEKTLGAKIKAERKALNVAIRKEGYELRKQLISEIRHGAPGGKPFKPRSYWSKAWRGSIRQPALYSLAVYEKHGRRTMPGMDLSPIRYHIPEKDPIYMQIGWVGPKVSKSWKYLAKIHQEGFTAPISDKRRDYLAKILGDKGKRSIYKRFIPKKTTTQIRTPARPIIAPFWAAHKSQALRNIRNNYRRKLAGERI
jgi:hypothetical protein